MLCWVASGRKRWIRLFGFSIGCPGVERRTGGRTVMWKWWPYREMRHDSNDGSVDEGETRYKVSIDNRSRQRPNRGLDDMGR
jgi:hypothetical protein